jgi:hypothetical protein
MATRKPPKKPIEDRDQVRDTWMARLCELVDRIDSWARELDWATRRIEKKMEDSQLGTYKAPALLMQKETTRVLLDPIARFVPGTEGLVDLYLMPAYDDIASLYFTDGGWRLHFPSSGPRPGATNSGETHGPLTQESLGHVLDEMVQNAI